VYQLGIEAAQEGSAVYVAVGAHLGSLTVLGPGREPGGRDPLSPLWRHPA
jgi:hypothetical protein